MTDETPVTPEGQPIEAVPFIRCTDCGATEPGGACPNGPHEQHNWGVFTDIAGDVTE